MSDQTPFDPVATLKAVRQRLEAPLTQLVEAEQCETLLAELQALIEGLERGEAESQFTGQSLLCNLINNHPQLTPLLDRDLLWYFGGDCLHFMPDDEIDAFQAREDAGEPLRTWRPDAH